MRKIAVALGLAIVLALGSAGASYALWKSQATASGTVTGGTIALTVTGGDSLAVVYGPTLLSKAGAITISNTGSVSGNYTSVVTLGTGSSVDLAKAVVVRAWSASSAADCSGSVPASALSGTWFAAPTLSGTLAAGTSVTWCLSTSVTTAQVAALPLAAISPTLTATVIKGSWVASAVTAVAQSVAKAAVPPLSTFTCVNPDDYNARITWSNPAGASDSTKYGVFVNGIQIENANYWYTAAEISRQDMAKAVADEGRYLAEVRIIGSNTVIYSGYLVLGNNGWDKQNHSNRTVQCG